jgi:hypothetical protein
VLLKDTQPGAVEVALGHRRLAILDLSPVGHQPMQDSVTGNWIVFNGEVCNFGEVTRISDVAFRSHADTEVILPAYPFWGQTASPGPACLQSGLEIGAPDAAAYAELHRRRKGRWYIEGVQNHIKRPKRTFPFQTRILADPRTPKRRQVYETTERARQIG